MPDTTTAGSAANANAEATRWIAAGRQGDEQACAAIYHYFSPAVRRLCLGLLGNLQDAEEVMQDSFVYALRNLGRYQVERSAFSTWLYTIAVSRCRNKRRGKWLTVVPLELLTQSTADRTDRQVESMLARRGVSRQVWDALQSLPRPLREALVLRYLAEMRYREVGQALGCNAKTAESRARAGLARMREVLRAAGVERLTDITEQWA